MVIPQRAKENEESHMIVWREFPGYSTERRNSEHNSLPDLRSQSWEFRKAKEAGVCWAALEVLQKKKKGNSQQSTNQYLCEKKLTEATQRGRWSNLWDSLNHHSHHSMSQAGKTLSHTVLGEALWKEVHGNCSVVKQDQSQTKGYTPNTKDQTVSAFLKCVPK